MKHKFKILAKVFVASLTFSSCQSDANLGFESWSIDEYEAANENTRSMQNEVHPYWDSFEKINWADLNSLEKRFMYFNLPEDQVKELPTESLLQLVVKYPLNYLVLAYNDPLDAVRLVYKNSNVHKELVKRDKAASILVNYFSKHHGIADINKPFDEYNYIDEVFIEHLLISGLMDIAEEKQNIISAINRKRELYEADPSMNSAFTMSVLQEIENYINPSYPTVSANTTTIYTPTFLPLVGNIYPELNQNQIDLNNSIGILAYPNALFVGTSTAKYNCHSFAWYNSSQTNTIWLNKTGGTLNGAVQLSKYWDSSFGNVVFTSCSEAEAERVYYSDDDHSAYVLSSTSQVISKWGPGPLMVHDVRDCPYTATNLCFYKFAPRETPYYSTANLSGNTSFVIGTTQEYRVSDYAPNITHSWSVTPISGQSNSSFEMTTNSSGNLLLKCFEYGAYKVRVNYYYYGSNITYKEVTVVAFGVPQ